MSEVLLTLNVEGNSLALAPLSRRWRDDLSLRGRGEKHGRKQSIDRATPRPCNAPPTPPSYLETKTLGCTPNVHGAAVRKADLESR